ncbi:MAG TPA: endonuclease/exonuclease/phosphatase family protein, partial [Bryobacteraceae bacterium]|nr:endonuclease/exonuclease/phosphatase family protein [Bryobacteraceae bacterium]
LILCFFAIACVHAEPEGGWLRDGGPELLSHADVVELAADSPSEGLLRKLDVLLATPIVSNAAARTSHGPRRPVVGGVGPVIRVALWNLERGYNLDQIALAFEQPSELLKLARSGAHSEGAARLQAEHLSGADVIIINEADLGVSRSDYADVTAHLATRLRMNYAFGAEFVEVDPILLGLEQPKGDASSVRDWNAEHKIDRERFRGLHGNAVLSRYPITAARLLRLPDCYDWYGKEKQSIAHLEKGRRWTARRLFEERISREIRRGGRIALIVELAVPEAPGGRVTVVSTHLENKCRPACRQDQMDAVMASLKEVPHAVIVGGDLNTTGTDAAPTSIRREITRRASSLKFWLGMAVRYGSPVTLPQVGLLPANHFKNYLDPSAFHLPLVLPNREDGIFTKVQRFRFADGGRFDFSGSPGRTRDRRSGTLGNSNQRHFKGFQPTFTFERTLGGIVGRYKLDWFFVKPAADGALAPHYPATMNELNEVSGSRISDHPPLTVDLPLQMNGSGAMP